MEIDMKVKATPEEMKSYFDFDEVLNIRFYEKLEGDIYRIRMRIPECKGINKYGKPKLGALKKRVVKLCPEEFGITGEAVFEKRRVFHAPNEYWLQIYIDDFVRRNGYSVVSVNKNADSRRKVEENG